MVKKIFGFLITIVAGVIIGAFVLNIFVPNVLLQIGNALEMGLYRGTGLQFDLNGDGVIGKEKDMSNKKVEESVEPAGVAGFKD